MSVKSLYPTVRPTLNLDFAKTRSLGPLVTFSRSGIGLSHDQNGLLKYSWDARFDHNPVTEESLGLLVEESRTNLALRSEELGVLGIYGSGVITPNFDISPSGLLNARRLSPRAGTGPHGAIFYNSNAYAPNGWQISAYVKPLGLPKLGIAVSSNWGVQYPVSTIDFDSLTFTNTSFGSSGILQSVTGQSVTNVGNGWYRVTWRWVYEQNSNATMSFICGLSTSGDWNAGQASWNFDGTSYVNNGFLIWGIQIESGSFPTSYIPSSDSFTSRASTATYYDSAGILRTAAINVGRGTLPWQTRFNTTQNSVSAFLPDSNGIMRNAGIVLEPAGTNLMLQSNGLSTSPWSVERVTISGGASSPDGGTSASSVTVNGPVFAVISQLVALTSGITYTYSVYIKPGTCRYYALGFQNSTNIADLQSGTFSSGSGRIEKLPGGYYRVSVSLVPTSTTTFPIYLYFTGSPTTPIDADSAVNQTATIWGAQLEASPYPTSYIPTVASQVTRSADVSSSATSTRGADVVSITGLNFTNWYNAIEGTLFANIKNSKSNGRIWEINDNTQNNRLFSAYGTSFSQFVVGIPSNISIWNSSITTSIEPRKTAFAYKSTDYAGVSNGLSPIITNVSSVPNVNRLWIGGPYDNGAQGQYPNGCISKITYWPVRLSNTTLQAITR